MKLIFATSNQNKVKEILSLAPKGVEILSLKDIGFTEELPETRATIEGNSLQKAEYLSTKFGIACFSEDTGLEINALDGEPGVYSARYAGPKATYDDNTDKVLYKMKNEANRTARFKTVITYYAEGKYVQFEGITEGVILEDRKGSAGFGYDPIFKPLGADKTYAEMTLEEKNSFSHRKKSFELFANHLTNIAVI
jgi:XTP/dITP diphosphohydrolase